MTTQVWQDTRYQPGLGARRAASWTLDLPLLVIGRLIFGGFFLYSGIDHFMNRGMMITYASSMGVPYPEIAILGTGALLFVGGMGIMTGLWPRLGAACVMLFLVGVTPVMHAFWNDPAGPQRMNNLANFTKNIGLFGAATILAAIPAHWAHRPRAERNSDE